MIKKIQSNLGLKIYLSLFILVFGVWGFSYLILSYSLPRTYQNDLESKFSTEMGYLVKSINFQSLDEVENRLIKYASSLDASFKVLDKNGEMVIKINHNNIGASISAEKGDAVQTISYAFSSEGDEYLLMGAISLESVSKTRQLLKQNLPLILFVTSVISAIGAKIIAHRIAAPIHSLSVFSRKIVDLDLSQRIAKSKRRDEIGHLEQDLNQMADNLQKKIEDLKLSNNNLNTEIKKAKELEKERTNFYSMISHELKTPITVIKGETEGMIRGIGDFKDRDKYLRNIYRTTNSMEGLVTELLLVAKLEGDHTQITKQAVSLNELISKVCDTLAPLAEDKDISIYKEIDPVFLILGDYQLLLKALQNIVLNGINYSPKYATVNILAKNRSIIITNSNVSIPEYKIHKLAQPFYRLDESRNSNSGGNGLGLYIVNTILSKHAFPYKIENSKVGVTFTIIIPESSDVSAPAIV